MCIIQQRAEAAFCLLSLLLLCVCAKQILPVRCSRNNLCPCNRLNIKSASVRLSGLRLRAHQHHTLGPTWSSLSAQYSQDSVCWFLVSGFCYASRGDRRNRNRPATTTSVSVSAVTLTVAIAIAIDVTRSACLSLCPVGVRSPCSQAPAPPCTAHPSWELAHRPPELAHRTHTLGVWTPVAHPASWPAASQPESCHNSRARSHHPCTGLSSGHPQRAE
jgi:hypothetical protein